MVAVIILKSSGFDFEFYCYFNCCLCVASFDFQAPSRHNDLVYDHVRCGSGTCCSLVLVQRGIPKECGSDLMLFLDGLDTDNRATCTMDERA